MLREVIDYFYISLFESNPDKNKIESLEKEVEKNTPDTEDFTTILVSSALDACGVIHESLNFLLDKQLSRIDSISTMAIDSVYMYIEVKESLDYNLDKDFKQKMDTDQLMKKESAMQSGIITFLCNSKSFDFGDLQTLLHLQENNKKGNLNL